MYAKGRAGKDGWLLEPATRALTLGQLVERFGAWVQHYNTKRPHTSLQGRTPLAGGSSSCIHHDNEKYFTALVYSGEEIEIRFVPNVREVFVCATTATS